MRQRCNLSIGSGSAAGPLRPLRVPRAPLRSVSTRSIAADEPKPVRETVVSPPSTSASSVDAAAASMSLDGAEMAAAFSDVPKRICIFVEPSPFTYVCGYKNRYQTMIRFLREQGAEVLVVTTGPGVTLPGYDFSAACEQPSDYHGAKVISCYSVGCPFYWSMPLSFALSPRIYKAVADFQPDLIHCSSPGLMVGAAWIYSRLLRLPLVKAYHTHIPAYLPRYGLSFLVNAMWSVLRFLHAAAHLTLTTSAQMLTELKGQRVAADRHIDVWKRGVDSDLFHPSYKCAAMRRRLTAGHPEDPVMIYCGRLGSEKNLTFLKGILERVPNLRLAFVGDGPSRGDLERHFRGTKTVFLGMLHGEELSQAYASGDLFAMPSESETLGFVVLEAMSAGLPVVAVRAGGLPDIIQRDGETGFLYESGDVTRAAELTRRLVEDPALRARIGAAAREEVSRWDWMAATRHLLLEQYPKAVRAARSYFGAKFRSPMIKGERAAVL